MRFQVCLEVQMLIECLVKHRENVGQIISYSELEHEAGEPIKGGGKGQQHLYSARQIVRKKYGLNFLVSPGDGVYLADDEHTARRGPHYQHKIRNQTKLFRLEQACIKDWDALSAEAKSRLDADRKMIGFIRLFTEERTVKKLEETPERVPKISLEQAMKLFED